MLAQVRQGEELLLALDIVKELKKFHLYKDLCCDALRLQLLGQFGNLVQ